MNRGLPLQGERNHEEEVTTNEYHHVPVADKNVQPRKSGQGGGRSGRAQHLFDFPQKSAGFEGPSQSAGAWYVVEFAYFSASLAGNKQDLDIGLRSDESVCQFVSVPAGKGDRGQQQINLFGMLLVGIQCPAVVGRFQNSVTGCPQHVAYRLAIYCVAIHYQDCFSFSRHFGNSFLFCRG